MFRAIYPLARRAAEVRSAAAVAISSIASADREDIEQQAMADVWQALPRFDSSRASLRTFIERVVCSKVASAVRSQRARRRALPDEALDAPGVWEPATASDSRVDVARVLVKLHAADRNLATLLVDHTPSEAGRALGISRSTVYEGIRRIRLAFVDAGIGSHTTRRSKREMT